METNIDEPPSYLLSLILASSITYFAASGVILLILLLLSAIVSGSEVAFFSLTQDDINDSDDSNKVDKTIIRLLEHPKRLLANILILNNTINVAMVTLATFVTWRAVGTQTPTGSVLVALTLIVTFLIVFFGEVIPKVFATQNNLRFARFTARGLALFNTLLWPISSFLMSISNFVEKRIENKGYEMSMEELTEALKMTTGEGTSEEEKEIIKGIMTFGTISVRQVMHSRMDIVSVDIEMDFHELMESINKSGYSRIPAFSNTIDNIKGILYIKDLLPHLEKDAHFQWQKLLRPCYFVPENKKIDTLLRDFQDKRVHVAIVVDEYGGTSGLITLEDVIEEIVGEIEDEYDVREASYREISATEFIFEGKTSMNDFCKIIDEDPASFEEVKGESESLGGLILEINKTLPNTDEEVKFGNYTFIPIAVDKRRIKKVKVIINESTKDADLPE